MSGDHMVSVMNVIGLVLVMLGIFMVVVAMPEQHTFLAAMALLWIREGGSTDAMAARR